MKSIFSVRTLVEGVRTAWQRFPEVNLAALMAFGVSVWMIHQRNEPSAEQAMPILWATLLGLPLFVGLSVWRFRRDDQGWRRWLPAVLGVAVLIVYALTADHKHEIYVRQFFVLNLALHLVVAFVAYVRVGEEQAFWHFNRGLFLRAVLTGIYSLTVWLGLLAALGALEVLFKVDVPNEAYGDTFVFCSTLLSTLIFTAGIPLPTDAVTGEVDYPKPLLNFVQFILLPLVTLYLVILYAYAIFILLGEIPKGIISWMVLIFSTLGIFALLLVRPLRDSPTKGWIRLYSRFFYPALLPLVVLLSYAIYLRVAPYGFTEPRYLLTLLGGWLFLLALAFTVRPRLDARVIPLSMAAVSLIAAIGPLSMGAVSKASQNRRLERILTEQGMLTNGAFRPSAKPLRDSLNYEITSILTYFNRWHGLRELSDWAQPTLASFTADSLLTVDTLLKTLRVPPTYSYDDESKATYRHLYRSAAETYSIEQGWPVVALLNFSPDTGKNEGARLAEPGLNISLSELGTLRLRAGSLPMDSVSLAREIERIAGAGADERETKPDSSFAIRFRTPNYLGYWRLHDLSAQRRNDTLFVGKLSGVLYLRPLKPRR